MQTYDVHVLYILFESIFYWFMINNITWPNFIFASKGASYMDMKQKQVKTNFRKHGVNALYILFYRLVLMGGIWWSIFILLSSHRFMKETPSFDILLIKVMLLLMFSGATPALACHPCGHCWDVMLIFYYRVHLINPYLTHRVVVTLQLTKPTNPVPGCLQFDANRP